MKKILIIFLLCFCVNCFSQAQTFYWENPYVITETDARFPTSQKIQDKNFLFWQEIDLQKKEIWLSCRRYENIEDYTEFPRFAGPFSYSNEVPDIYSVAYKETADGKSTIAVAVLSDISEISIYISSDDGQTFEKSVLKTNGTSIAPRIYVSRQNKYILFFSENKDNEFTISYCLSDDGKKWSQYKNFTPTATMRNPFIPVLTPTENGDLVVFQSQYTNPQTGRFSYQLYSTYSKDNGNSWTTPSLLTGSNSLYASETRDFTAFQNQRPYLYNYENNLYLAWERTDTVTSSIWFSQIDKTVPEECTLVKQELQRISESGNASRAILFDYDGKLYLVWFDTRRGKESVYLAQKNGTYWQEQSLVENNYSNTFAFPLVTENKNGKNVLAFAWQQKVEKTGNASNKQAQNQLNQKNSICILLPDTTVKKPDLIPLTYKKNKKSGKKSLSVQIKFPPDSSQIAGYSYTWEKDNALEPSEKIQKFTKENKINLRAEEDGTYYLSVKVADYAGNWSEPEEIQYVLDLTPPKPLQILNNHTDKDGLSKDNSFRIWWNPSEDDDVAGYAYKLEFLGNIPKKMAVSSRHPLRLTENQLNKEIESIQEKYKNSKNKQRKFASKIQTVKTNSEKFYNLKNGVYAFSVAAIDEVGNVGESTTELVILNKFEPRTYISYIEQQTDELGSTVLSIKGGGFLYDGTISKIYIDEDGKAPYDCTLDINQKQYRIVNDSKITDIQVDGDLKEGIYRIGLLHTDRGLYFSKDSLKITPNGTIKIESEYTENKYTPIVKDWKYTIFIVNVVLIFMALYLIISIIVMAINCVREAKEDNFTQKQVSALVLGEPMPKLMEKQKKMRRTTVKKKLVRFTYILIIIVVLMVTFQTGMRFVSLQEKTIAEGLQNRIDVLLKSISSGTENFFPTNNILELSALPSQKDAMSEVEYVTILGQKSNELSSENLKYIWATNDPEIENKIDSYRFTYGESQITEEKIIEILKKYETLDLQINAKVGENSKKIDELTTRANELALSSSAEDQSQMDNLSQIAMDLRNNLDQTLDQIAESNCGSYPQFNPSQLDRTQTEYIFYYPVLYRQGKSDNYLHCVIIAQVSTKELIENLNKEVSNILMFCTVIAIIAVILGVIGAYLFASILVKPIKKLESHVNLIGHTKNKLDLRGKDIEITTKDEIGHLGDSINSMVHDMITVAEEEEVALDGKAVQKAFLPLVAAGHNDKNTYAEYEDKNVQCFGYYEGESGVSGDYFDYKRLDNEWFVMIKCDASGHGIPAAIIMTVVATIFRRFFASWEYKKNGINLNKLVEQINDFIESLGLRGKFATLIICLLNMKNGELYMCNAGDNLVHIYDGATKKMKTITLASLPTAGVFSSDLVAMRGGFKVEKTQLKKGDVLFLYTDGIEESTRRVRNSNFDVIQEQVEVKKINPKTHQEEVEFKTEDAKEEFGTERIEQIIENVFNKKKYVLTKKDNPNVSESLEFDFTKGDGSLSEVILALASIEKVYRMYKPENVKTTEYIKIDKKIDEFLKEYFNLYPVYSAQRVENPSTPNYVDYEQVLEDEQSDDLTMLAIRLL